MKRFWLFFPFFIFSRVRFWMQVFSCPPLDLINDAEKVKIQIMHVDQMMRLKWNDMHLLLFSNCTILYFHYSWCLVMFSQLYFILTANKHFNASNELLAKSPYQKMFVEPIQVKRTLLVRKLIWHSSEGTIKRSK